MNEYKDIELKNEIFVKEDIINQTPEPFKSFEENENIDEFNNMDREDLGITQTETKESHSIEPFKEKNVGY